MGVGVGLRQLGGFWPLRRDQAGRTGGVPALLAALLLAGCVPPPYVRITNYPEGTLYVTNDPRRIAREALHYGLAAPRGQSLGGFWVPHDRVGWALDKPHVIAHERCHMLGHSETNMASCSP